MTFGIYQGTTVFFADEFGQELDDDPLGHGITSGNTFYWRPGNVTVEVGDTVILNDDGTPFLDFKYLLDGR